MTKDELIVKQQLGIETLKIRIGEYKQASDDALNCLYHPEQWNMNCPDFPKVAMRGILTARDALRH
jgi:hypothetical protein